MDPADMSWTLPSAISTVELTGGPATIAVHASTALAHNAIPMAISGIVRRIFFS
jgi:hypothetical protein